MVKSVNKLLYQQTEKTVNLLKSKKLTVSTAESCTGGMLSAYITSVPGVSEIFELGITSYSCRVKNKILGVDGQTLEDCGAISEQTAREMAQNVKRISDSDIGVSVTGAAGPDGSEGHAPGLVFIALACDEFVTARRLDIEPKSRNFVRETAVSEVLKLIDDFSGRR